MNNLSRLYLIRLNLKVLRGNIAEYNLFDNIGFTEELQVMDNMIERMGEVLDDMRKEVNK